jgi:hypothetical protein
MAGTPPNIVDVKSSSPSGASSRRVRLCAHGDDHHRPRPISWSPLRQVDLVNSDCDAEQEIEARCWAVEKDLYRHSAGASLTGLTRTSLEAQPLDDGLSCFVKFHGPGIHVPRLKKTNKSRVTNSIILFCFKTKTPRKPKNLRKSETNQRLSRQYWTVALAPRWALNSIR